MRKNFLHYIFLLTIIVNFSFGAVKADSYTYKEELKQLKKKQDYEIIFDKEAHLVLRYIAQEVENSKKLSRFQRFVRSSFLSLDTVVVTAQTMPKLYSYVHSVAQANGIKTPTVFVTKDKWFFNAMAEKLLISSGAIVLGQKLVYEVSDEEIEAVVAHEIGHIYGNHSNKHMAAHLGTSALIYLCLPPLPVQARIMPSLIAGRFLSSLMIGKQFEREADEFACENQGQARGIIKYFQRLIEKEKKQENDFKDVSQNISKNSRHFYLDEYFLINLKYYLARGSFKIDRMFTWFYHNTIFGSHPPHQERIDSAQKYLDKNEKLEEK